MAEHEDRSVDVSYLSDAPAADAPRPRSRAVIAEGSLGKDFHETSRAQGGSSIPAVERTMAQASMQPTPRGQRVDMKTVDVKCNYARGRIEVMGELIMHFDQRLHS